MSKGQQLPAKRIAEMFEGVGIKLNQRSVEQIKTISEDLDAEEGGIDAETARDISDELNDMVDDLASIASDLSEPQELEDDKPEEEDKPEEFPSEEEGIDHPTPPSMDDEDDKPSFERFGEDNRSARLTEALIKGTYKVPGVNPNENQEDRKQRLTEALINKSYKMPSAQTTASVLGTEPKQAE